jgi:hypothetical protein
MVKPVTIDKGAEPHPALNYDFLRSTGIRLVQELAGKTWTDYNLHDPGITILEALCYAITDLAYRTDFPIQDLLANRKGAIDYGKNAFFYKEDILQINPVTVYDYRKVLIDQLEEIENVWLYPLKPEYARGALTGLYKIVVQVTRQIAEDLLTGRKTDEEIISRVKNCFVSRRNLCEDVINDIVILRPVKVAIEADIQVASQLNAEQVLASVYHQLENSLNVPVRYFSESELLDQGYDIDEIYAGPYLKNGFIPDSELGERKTLIDPTELLKTVSQIEGVLSVKKLRILNGQQSRHNKPLKIDAFSFPLLDTKGSEPHIKLYHENFELTIRRPVFRSILQKVRESENRSFISALFTKSARSPIHGHFRDNTRYFSIQKQFPKAYGIGAEGLMKGATDLRKAQAKQLKGYLLFFEQIMANYLGQLDNIDGFFSTDLSRKDNAATYYTAPLYDVPGIKDLLKAFSAMSPDHSDYDWEAFIESRNNDYIRSINAAAESDEVFLHRKTLLFEHLFARFNEFVTAYPVQLYADLYESSLIDGRVSSELTWKSALLRNIAKLGAGRVRAFNYLDPAAGSDDIHFEQRMRMLLHIRENDPNHHLSAALDPEKLIIEPGDSQLKETADGEEEEADEQAWLGDMPRILIDKAEMHTLAKRRRIQANDELPQDAFLLKRQDVSVLKHALEIRNFRIGPDPAGGTSYLVLYKAPEATVWKTISRFPDATAAMKALKNLIQYLRDVNIHSEGFYLMEHILLRPDLDSSCFGFRYMGESGEKLMEHSRWTSFRKREEILGSLLKTLTAEQEITAEKLAPLCRINRYPSEDSDPHDYFRTQASNRGKFLSRLEMVVKNDDGTVIPEDFFNLKMSIILPSWPARFQDKNFRDAAENLFRMNAPAHITLTFIWMNVGNLKKFEALYFDWKKFMAEGMAKETRSALRNALIQLLLNYR